MSLTLFVVVSVFVFREAIEHRLQSGVFQLLKCSISIILVLIDIAFTFYVNKSGDIGAFICLYESRFVLQSFAVAVQLRTEDHYFNNSVFQASFTLQALCSSLSVYYPLIISDARAHAYHYSLLGLKCMSICAGLYWIMKYLRSKRESSLQSIVTDTSSEVKGCIIYILGYMVCIFVYVVGQLCFLCPTYEEMSLSYIVFINAYFHLYFVIVPFMHWHILAKKIVSDESDLIIRFISHEMRTPLTAIMIGSNLLSEELEKLGLNEEEDELSPLIQDIRRATDATLGRLNNILLQDSLRQGIYFVEKISVTAVDFLFTNASIFKNEARIKGVHLTVMPVGDLDNIKINIDPVKMGQVLGNLISNGLKFTPTRGSVVVSMEYEESDLTLSASFHGCLSIGVVKITVKDTGHGMSQRELDGLFTSAVQYKPGKLQNGGGFGLGLVISKGIVDLHSADLSASSGGLGRGCTFILKIPAYKEHPGMKDSPFKPVVSTHDLNISQSLPQPLPHSPSLRRNRSNSIVPSDAERKVDEESVLVNDTRRRYLPPLDMIPININPVDEEEIGGIDAQSNDWHFSHSESQISDSVSSNAFADVDDYGSCLRSYTRELVESTEHLESYPVNCQENIQSDATVSLNNSQDQRNGTPSRSLFQRRNSRWSSSTLPSTVSNSRVSVLVVEDSALTRKMLVRALKNRFQDVSEAEDGVDALALYDTRVNENAKAFDLITMDFSMRKMDGPAAARALRSRGFRGKIAGVTGNVLPQDVQTFLEAGADAVFYKPLDFEEFDVQLMEWNFVRESRQTHCSHGNEG